MLLTLFGALPVYRRIARLSPHGEGSISVLESLLPRRRSKALVLCLLGFAATDFVITITLSAADATAHIVQNPFVPPWADHNIVVTLILRGAWGHLPEGLPRGDRYCRRVGLRLPGAQHDRRRLGAVAHRATAHAAAAVAAGVEIGPYRVLRCQSPAVPNAIAALLLDIRNRTSKVPHAYFGWTEGNPVVYLLKFIAFGEGDTAPVTREVLRQVEPDSEKRPRIHVG